MAENTPRFLLLGEILRPHGVRGELRMRVLTAYPETIAEREEVFLGDGPEASRVLRRHVTHLRMHQGYALITFQGITNRSEAEPLRGLFVMIRTEDAVPLEDDEIYLYQIIGMTVKTTEGKTLGTVSEVIETGANDVYLVKSRRHGDILIPATEEVIVHTDVDDNVITVNLIEGLLPE